MVKTDYSIPKEEELFIYLDPEQMEKMIDFADGAFMDEVLAEKGCKNIAFPMNSEMDRWVVFFEKGFT